jgi:hypothetical protein
MLAICVCTRKAPRILSAPRAASNLPVCLDQGNGRFNLPCHFLDAKAYLYLARHTTWSTFLGKVACRSLLFTVGDLTDPSGRASTHILGYLASLPMSGPYCGLSE